MLKRSLILVSALTLLCSSLLFNVSAQDAPPPTPEEVAAAAADTRQALFKLLRHNLGPIAGMARGAPFDAAIAERNARRIAAIAPMIPELLTPDTRGFDLETEALNKIWEGNLEDIGVKAQALVDAANTFAGIAAAGDMAATLGAFRSLGGACANCHDVYRVDNN
ncbi:MAG: cytochrome c [Gammaproteobacteria bacterium]|nr:cytochrome c [Gammaproteobacteria bacterium]